MTTSGEPGSERLQRDERGRKQGKRTEVLVGVGKGVTKEGDDKEVEEVEVDEDVLVEVEEVEDELVVECGGLTVDGGVLVTTGVAADGESGQWSEMKCI